jgi:membrane protein implicated in regulation of membrane protease activity
MKDTRSHLGLGLLALMPIACCIGVPLIAAAGVSVALAAWIGGVALATVVLIAVVVLLVLRARRYRHEPPSPFIARGRP